MSISKMTLGDHADIVKKYNIEIKNPKENTFKTVWFVPVVDENDAAIRLRRLNISKKMRQLGYHSYIFETYYQMDNSDVWRVVEDFDVFVFTQFDKRTYELMLFIRDKKPDAVLIRDHCEGIFDLEYEAECFNESNAVVCSSRFLRDETFFRGFTNSYFIPDSVEDIDYEKYEYKCKNSNIAVFMGGYSQSRVVSELLLNLIYEAGYELELITENPNVGKKWTLDTWVEDFIKCDVSLCTQPHGSPAKSNVKIITAMAFGMPVLASPIPSYSEIINSGKNGYLCIDLEHWKSYLEKLKDLDLRKEIGEKGKETALDFSVEKITKKWISLFDFLL